MRACWPNADATWCSWRATPVDWKKPAPALARDFPERSIDAIATDLTDPDTTAMLAARLEGREIGLLVYNAGSNWRNAAFLDNTLDYARTITALNATAPMALCHHFGGLMRQRGRGGIILISSLAYLVGSPRIAVYSAAKAFSTTLAEALWFELKPPRRGRSRTRAGERGHTLYSAQLPRSVRSWRTARRHRLSSLSALGEGPVLRAGQGDAFHKRLSGMSRADAVEAIYNAGKAYQD